MNDELLELIRKVRTLGEELEAIKAERDKLLQDWMVHKNAERA